MPGVQHFAHAGEVAWAITNAMADYQDVYVERVCVVRASSRGARTGRLGAVDAGRDDRRGRRPDEAVEVVATERGPVFSGSLERRPRAEPARAVRRCSATSGFDAMLPLLRARTADDVDAALDDWVEPVNNVVIADRHGDVRYRVAGRVPVRAEANRRGIVDAADPDDGLDRLGRRCRGTTSRRTAWSSPPTSAAARESDADRRRRSPRRTARPGSATCSTVATT